MNLDGNAAAGVLREVFTEEMTTSECRCESCHRLSALGQLLMYGGAMGVVLRCPRCTAIVLRVTSARRGWFVEMRGVIHVTQAGPVADS